MDSQTYPAKTIAKVLDLSLARVGQLAKEGLITREEGGRYRISAVTEYIQYLRGGDSGKLADGNSKDFTQLLDEERWRKMKRENDLEEKDIARVVVLENALTDAARQILPLLDSIPVEMKRDNPELTGSDIKTAKTTVAKCRNIIADLELSIDDNE